MSSISAQDELTSNDSAVTVAPVDLSEQLRLLPLAPGVYRMLDAAGEVLYVGKAKSLKSRVSSYFSGRATDSKTMAMVRRVVALETTVTGSETEALLLEQNLIKAHRPPFNVMLRDDKSYPFIRLSGNAQFPGLGFYRGRRREGARYYGPYPNAAAVRETLGLLQKVFRVRQCDESFFRNRTRPCLQYQIDRCSGPCVGLVQPEAYAEDLRHALMFLEGRSQAVCDELADQMEAAAAELEFESAARLRDQISRLQRLRAEQSVVAGGSANVDVLAAALLPGGGCVEVLSIRDGRVLGSRCHYPEVGIADTPAALLDGFVPQYYLGKGVGVEIPALVVVSEALEDAEALAEALTGAKGQQVTVRHQVRGERARWLRMARDNAQQHLSAHLANRENMRQRFEQLQVVLGVEDGLGRVECFDVSHTQGSETVASCVVFGPQGPVKSDYRRYNITGIEPGDDYAAMRQALERRYTRLKKGEAALPDLLLIDGGKGQLAQAKAVMDELQVEGVLLLGIAKGTTRKPGMETLFLASGAVVSVPEHSPALHLLQQIRDEAHRFAITGHRQRRGRAQGRSVLEEIEGVGPKRRRALLRHFGGMQQMQHATVDELAKVPGISRALAARIHSSVRGEERSA